LSPEYLKRRKKKKQKSQIPRLIPAMSNYALIMLVVLFFGAILSALAFARPQLAIVLLGFGYLVAFVGGVWFPVVAFQESALWGLLCIFVPFASLVFLVMHLEETWRPFVLNLVGAALIGAGFGISIAKGLPTDHLPVPPGVSRPAEP